MPNLAERKTRARDTVYRLRKEHELTQVALARLVDLTEVAIASIEMGRNSIPPPLVSRFAEVFGVSPKEFMLFPEDTEEEEVTMILSAAEQGLVIAYRRLPDCWRAQANHFLEHNEAALAVELWVLGLLENSQWFKEVTCLQRRPVRRPTGLKPLSNTA